MNAQSEPSVPLTAPTLRKIAAKIENNRHLRAFLRKLNPEHRRAFYDALRPFLSFRPLPFPLMR